MTDLLSIYQENALVVRRVIARYWPHKDDIDDLAQEAFLKCFAASLKTEIRDPRSFLLRVARNLAISERRRKIYSTTYSLEDFGTSDILADKGSPSVEDVVYWRQKMIVFANALASLPEAKRRVLVMRKIEGLQVKQIAIRLGVSVSTVEKRVAAALVACSSYLRRQGYECGEFGAASKAPALQSDTNERDALKP